MNYKIILDSSGEIPKQFEDEGCFQRIPLTLYVDDETIIDDDTFDQADFLKKVAASANCAKTACPSPESFMNAYHCDAEDVYVITLSANLSGSYNSACLGKHLYEEKYGKKNIHVVDSCSASVGQSQIALKALELAKSGKSFEEIVPLLEKYRDDEKTYFILDNLETLRKNGRLTKAKALVATTLSIKPIMCGNDQGEIEQISQAIGMKKALQKLADMIVKDHPDSEFKRLMISHCNCETRALQISKLLQDRAKFRDIHIVEMRGLSSTYANDGGIIITI